ncbi:MAG: toprim domain-containing protein [Candidatus Moraniibacteriota bacterium]|nr:MAG: toprim domain-containing protein [Candidatus Moranbacteria bacterium]
MTPQTISEYLNEKNIPYTERGNELITKCLFSSCDQDSREGEAHLYFNKETGQYDCKKCGAKGNLLTLKKHCGDSSGTPRTPKQEFSVELMEDCYQKLPLGIRQYLNARGISDETITRFKLGYGTFYRKKWITIPIKDTFGNYAFFKLRQDPNFGDDKITYPKGVSAQLYDWENLSKPGIDRLVLCEGEMDRLLLESKGIAAVTSTHGAGTFKEEWAEHFSQFSNVFVCYDNDTAGKKGAERAAGLIAELNAPETHIIHLPETLGAGGDITDYFTKHSGTTEELLSLATPYPEKIDPAHFSPLSSQDLANILNLTIKHDVENKIAAFLCELSAYSEDSQFNISFNAPSSTGKSYIPTEIARLFPEEDVMELAYCSPTAFFHDAGEFNKELQGYLVDLSRKIVIFLDQPHSNLLAHLRPLLSHDKKEINIKITDKGEKHGLRTKNIILRGYPSVIFCTAGLQIDEQEATRFLLLSPEINQDKIRESISQAVRKASDSDAFNAWLEEDPERALLKERIRAIKQANIHDIKIDAESAVKEQFLSQCKMLKPRHSRDIKRLISIIKSFAILNLWWREKEGKTIIANASDVDEAFKLWAKISVSQELNLPPYVYDLYQEIILSAWKEKNDGRSASFEDITGKLGITRQEILQKHYKVHGKMLDNSLLRMQILPMLETAGLITQEQDPNDKRKILIFPATTPEKESVEGNSETGGGVKDDEKLAIEMAVEMLGGTIVESGLD